MPTPSMAGWPLAAIATKAVPTPMKPPPAAPECLAWFTTFPCQVSLTRKIGGARQAVKQPLQGKTPGPPRAYLLLTYFSRRICAVPSPAAFSASKQASTMSGLPHR